MSLLFAPFPEGTGAQTLYPSLLHLHHTSKEVVAFSLAPNSFRGRATRLKDSWVNPILSSTSSTSSQRVPPSLVLLAYASLTLSRVASVSQTRPCWLTPSLFGSPEPVRQAFQAVAFVARFGTVRLSLPHCLRQRGRGNHTSKPPFPH